MPSNPALDLFRRLAGLISASVRPGDPEAPNAWREECILIFINAAISLAFVQLFVAIFSGGDLAPVWLLLLLAIAARYFASNHPFWAGRILLLLNIIISRVEFRYDLLAGSAGGIAIALLGLLGSILVAPWAGLPLMLFFLIGLPISGELLVILGGYGFMIWTATNLLERAVRRNYESVRHLTLEHAHLLQFNSELEQRVYERTEELAITRERALEASRTKGQMVAKVSHELRTPLGGILGYAELLKNSAFGPVNEEQKQVASEMIESANYLNSLVSELLDELQIEAKTIVLKKEKFSVARFLDSAASEITRQANSKGLELITTISPELPESLCGDERRLRQILLHLTGNAVKFTPQGRVTVSLQRKDATHWMIQVADTGIGIPQEAQKYIWDTFRQASNAITNENRGIGLGLSITRHLVDLMGGTIDLLSGAGEGTTLTVTLPIEP